jgi:uncharacterized protein (TIGR03437 family)
VSICGDRLADAIETGTPPLREELGGVRVSVAGRPARIYYASDKRLDLIIPSDVEINATQQILVRRGLTYARPVPVSIAAAQPAFFASRILIRSPEGDLPDYFNSPERPARAGDSVFVLATGLGPGDPPVPDGHAAPDPAIRTAAAPVFRIGDREIPAVSSVLMPGMIGMYLVQFTIPDTVPEGSALPLTLEVLGQRSPAAAIAVRNR